MPLSAAQEQLEHELRVEQMTTTIDAGRVNIEKMRADMAKATADATLAAKWENRRFVVSVIVGAAACVGAGVALANYVNSRTPSAPPPPPQVIYLVPGPPPAPAPAPPR